MNIAEIVEQEKLVKSLDRAMSALANAAINTTIGKPTQPSAAPEGFYFTGEFRNPTYPDIFLSDRGHDMYTTDYWNGPGQPRWILRPIPPKPEIDGWEAMEYRKPKKGETCADPYTDRGVFTASFDYDEYDDASYWILTPKPAPTTISSVYGTSTPEIPKGWEMTGEFREPANDNKEPFLAANTTPPGVLSGEPCYTGGRGHRLILRKSPPPPRRWVVEVEETPEGFYTYSEIYRYLQEGYLNVISVTPKEPSK